MFVAPELGEIGDVDTDIVTLRFTNGTIGVIENSRKSVFGYDQRLEVFCTEGNAIAANQAVNTVVQGDARGFHSAVAPRFFMQRYPETYVDELRIFVDCVLNDGQPPVTGEDGRQSVIMGHAAWKSYRENRPVRLDEIC